MGGFDETRIIKWEDIMKQGLGVWEALLKLELVEGEIN